MGTPIPLLSPEVTYRHEFLQPPAIARLTKDDYLSAWVYTTAPTTGLVLVYRYQDTSGAVHYGRESLDGAATSTLIKKTFQLTEGFILGVTASNLGGGLADQVCFVVVGLQQSNQVSQPPHTILTQGYVTNVLSVNWPPSLARGPATVGGGGGVSSVGLAAPPEFTVTGSPITTSGTLTLLKALEAANVVWAGPTTGAAVAPTFRALVAADIPPALNATTVPTPALGDNSTNVATTAFVANAYRLNRVVVITATGTYTPATGTRGLYVECVGGGGAGGGAPVTSSNASAGSGGGSGQYSAVWVTGTIKPSYSVTIGAGGTGVSGAIGNPGGDTTFDSPPICTGKAGGGGQVTAATVLGAVRGGLGGSFASGIGDLRSSGNVGQPAIVLSATLALGGNGGPSIYGGAMWGPIQTATGITAGAVGNPYGSGGTGAVSVSAGAATGGAGAAGVINVWEYF